MLWYWKTLHLRFYPHQAKAKVKATCHLEGMYGFKPGYSQQEEKEKAIFTSMGPEGIKQAIWLLLSISLSLVWVDLKSPFTSSDSDASATSLQHHSQIGCKAIPCDSKISRYHSHKCLVFQTTPKELIIFGSNGSNLAVAGCKWALRLRYICGRQTRSSLTLTLEIRTCPDYPGFLMQKGHGN